MNATAQEKLDAILDSLKSGKTVFICTHLRTTKVVQRNVDAFNKIERPLFKVSGKSLYMSVGKRYDCIDYVTIRIT